MNESELGSRESWQRSQDSVNDDEALDFWIQNLNRA